MAAKKGKPNMTNKTKGKNKGSSKSARGAATKETKVGGSTTKSAQDKAPVGAKDSSVTQTQQKKITGKDGSVLLHVKDDLYMAEDPVTWRQYLQFCEESGRGAPPFPDFFTPMELVAGAHLDHPVVNVSFFDAMAYCNHYGLTLPTEEEWFHAATAGDGRQFPWGNDQPTAEHLNCAEFGPGRTTPVGNYPKGNGPFGHRDLAGNVWEWCRDPNDKPEEIVKLEPKKEEPAAE